MIANKGGAVAIERTDLELVWPADLFRQEGQALLAAGNEDELTLAGCWPRPSRGSAAIGSSSRPQRHGRTGAKTC